MSISKINLHAIGSKIEISKSEDVSAATSVDRGARVREAHLTKVEFSDNAKIFAEAINAVKGAPDVRLDRISELKTALANGTYKIDSVKLADKMFAAHLLES